MQGAAYPLPPVEPLPPQANAENYVRLTEEDEGEDFGAQGSGGGWGLGRLLGRAEAREAAGTPPLQQMGNLRKQR